MHKVKHLLAAGVFLAPAAIVLAPITAQATPYAFASNDITGLEVTYSNGSSILTGVQSATTNASDVALFGNATPSSNQGAGTVGNALNIGQAYAGPGPAPSTSFTPVGAGNFTGTRSDASISSGSAASGGVQVRNVAEGYGTAVGNSTGNNSSTITFQVVGSGLALLLKFNDAIHLIASTAALPQETATASLTNTFSVTASGASSPLATYQPSELNRQISSQFGTPPMNEVISSALYSFTTPTLTAGVVYNISLSSGASENISPGSTAPVPEPTSLTILGMGLLGLWGMGSLRRR